MKKYKYFDYHSPYFISCITNSQVKQANRLLKIAKKIYYCTNVPRKKQINNLRIVKQSDIIVIIQLSSVMANSKGNLLRDPTDFWLNPTLNPWYILSILKLR